MIIDLHADTPMWMSWAGYDFLRGHERLLPRGAWVRHVDLPRMREAGMSAQLFGLVALPAVHFRPWVTINREIDATEAMARRSNDAFRLVRTYAELQKARDDGAKAGLLSMEGVHPLQGKLRRLDTLAARGVVSVGISHFHRNAAAYPMAGWGKRPDAGLTDFGRRAVERIGELGMCVDLTHINRPGFFDAIAHLRGPVLVSHTGVRGAYDHWRNLDDEQIRAVADRGGVIGVIFAAIYVGGNDIDAVVRHLRHLIDVGGEACAALGSDYDGMITPVAGLSDVRGLPRLRDALLRSGLPPRVVDNVMGENVRAFFERSLPA